MLTVTCTLTLTLTPTLPEVAKVKLEQKILVNAANAADLAAQLGAAKALKLKDVAAAAVENHTQALESYHAMVKATEESDEDIKNLTVAARNSRHTLRTFLNSPKNIKAEQHDQGLVDAADANMTQSRRALMIAQNLEMAWQGTVVARSTEARKANATAKKLIKKSLHSNKTLAGATELVNSTVQVFTEQRAEQNKHEAARVRVKVGEQLG